MNNQQLIKQELLHASDVLDKVLSDATCMTNIDKAAQLFVDSFKNGGKAISCGNGGSHCDAMHFAEELTGRFRDEREPLPAISIAEPSHMSCVGNDYGFNYVFSRFIKAVATEKDVILCISTSGNSKNILEAIKEAKKKGAKVVVLTGNGGGQMIGMADVEICVPHYGYADRIQEIHIKVIHILILLIEKLTV
ncbi:D-sedoheptulose 7-phosphate isomerase [Fulvivirga sp. M361]|uniref:D-sedoheptulose 7-phosphate isomerase n=1 Tax=Fulvivirga sp. M361 TaxID=2594266 RepID=UPI00117AB40B|nr:D-sedoheptulose 7-phosphate isomerase [Fulvivirga sp. M361]TRX59013.1 D-sedoheptulose 7-phosphate isomerase [Fulvivirga sp. M361]